MKTVINSPTRDRPEVKKSSGPRINTDILSPEVRLIDKDGEMLGVVNIKKALEMAIEAGLDLVEISPNVKPPVCKILDYGKYKYEQQKKKVEAKKKQKVVELKEIQMRPMIDTNDFDVKCRKARVFLEGGNKVKFVMRFRGREVSHHELGLQVLLKVRDMFEEIAKVDHAPKLDKRQIIMVLSAR